MVEALATGESISVSVAQFVHRRCRDGWQIDELLEDLDRLRPVLPVRARRSLDWTAIRCEAISVYVDEVSSYLVSANYRNGFSGLPNGGYMAAYLDELARAQGDVSGESSSGHVMVTVRVNAMGRSLWERLVSEIDAGQLVRSSVPPEVTVAHVNVGHFVMVLPPLLDAGQVADQLDHAFARRGTTDLHHIDVTPLKASSADVSKVVASWRN